MSVLTDQFTENETEIRPHWSYSSINEYMLCPLKYYFHRVAKYAPEKTSVNMILGKALHAVYAYILSLIFDGNSWSININDMETFFINTFGSLLDEKIHYSKGSSYEDVIQQGKQYCQTIIDYLTVTKSFIYGQEELWIERDFTVPLIDEDGNILELPLTGIFDSVIIDHDKLLVQIIDFKTSASQYPDWKTYRNLQMIIYTYAMQQLLGKEYRIAFRWEVLLKQKNASIVEYDYLCNEQDIKYMIKTIQHIAAAIARQIFYPAPSFLCMSCEYHQACNNWF